MVEGISELSEGVLLGERYRLVRRLEIFAAGAERVAGGEYECWLAVDVTSEAEVWLQFAAADGVYASGAELAGAVTALRRINHPAVPAVHAFGEYEFEVEGAVTTVGYCAMPALEGETLAAVLLREELDQAEVLAALAQVAEVLELLAEFELVHGSLNAHSVLLIPTENAGYQVVLVDLPASLAVQTAVESDLSVAADVYALAWLTVLALIGVGVLEAEFGAGFAVTAEAELLLAGDVVLRRGAWAAENLVVLGVSEALAGVLLLALGEQAGARPRAAALTAALRAEWMLLATGVEAGVQAEVQAEAVAEVAAEEVVAEEVVAQEVLAEEVVAQEVAAEEVVAEEVVAEEVVEVARKKPRKSAAAKGAAAGAVAGAIVAAEIAGAGTAQAAQGIGAGAGTAAGAVVGVGEVTETIPRVPRAPRPQQSGAGTGSRAGSAAGSGAVAGSVSAVGAVGYSGGSSSGEHRGPRKPKTGLLIGAGIGVVVIIALVITITSGSSNKSNTASSGSIGTATSTASQSAGAGASSGAGGGSSASASSGATSGSGSSTATSAAGSETFPSTLTTVPASASQAVQEIQSVVNQASGELTGTQQAQLTQVISTLKQEIGSGQSISTGMTQFWALLHSNELPSSLNTYLTQFAEYLSASQGS